MFKFIQEFADYTNAPNNVRDKSLELGRILELKRQSLPRKRKQSLLTSIPICASLCIKLAYEQCNEPLNQQQAHTLLNRSGTNAKNYSENEKELIRLIDLKLPSISISELGLKFGCTCAHYAMDLWIEFSTLAKAVWPQVDESNRLYTCALFYYMNAYENNTLTKEQTEILIGLCKTHEQTFFKTVGKIKELMDPRMNAIIGINRSERTKTSVYGPNRMIPWHSYKESKQFKEYLEWKQKMLNDLLHV